MPAVESPPVDRTNLKGHPRLKRELQRFLQTDNFTNLFYIARVYVVLALTIGGAVLYFDAAAAGGWSWWWNMPVLLLAIPAVGASQHQLAGAGHEATHHTLFKNRRWNELASDWLCMFPIFTTTYSFRLYHLAHHQFINDPVRDPDFNMLAKSGHWMGFPVSKARFLAKVFSQVFLVGLARYILVRFQLNSAGVAGESPYGRGKETPKLRLRVALSYFVGILLLQIPVCYGGSLLAAVLAAAACWCGIALFILRLHDRHFEEARLRPVISARATALSRTVFITALFAGLSCLQILSGAAVWWYFLLLWAVPLFTSFPFFMILRQLIQHGNGDRGWITNTRVFLVNPLVRYAVFPFGMDYHLPHHMYATVPHYRLPALHEFLLKFPDYAEQALVVENYVLPKRRNPLRNPTCVEVVGPDYAPRRREVYVDDSVLDGWDIDGKAEILRHSQDSKRGTPLRGVIDRRGTTSHNQD